MSSMTEIEEEPIAPPQLTVEDKLFIAVKAELKSSKAIIQWAVNHFTVNQRIVIAHVHRPAQLIPILGGKFPASSLRADQVNAYRTLERDKINKALNEYVTWLSQYKVRAETLMIEMDDVAKGIVELIELHGITKLVMGAASDKHFSRKMKELKSKTAITVKQGAKPTCNIWFVCKGNLISTREASSILPSSGLSPMITPSSTPSRPARYESSNLSSGRNESSSVPRTPMHASTFRTYSSYSDGNMSPLSYVENMRTQSVQSRLSMGGSSYDPWPWEGISRTSHSSGQTSSVNDETLSTSGTFSLSRDDGSEANSVKLPLGFQYREMEDYGLDYDLCFKLQEAIKEAENLKNEAYEESCRRRKAEMNALLARQKENESRSLLIREEKLRKEIEVALTNEKLEVEKLKDQNNEIFERLQTAMLQKLELENKVANSDQIAKEFEGKLLAARHLLQSLKHDNDLLQRQRDEAIKDAEDIHLTSQHMPGTSGSFNLEFSYMELEQATENFSNSLKIGEGGFGIVYKGLLRNTTVAIKMMHPQSLQGHTEFQQEVSVLSRVRHPNLVTLIGACSETLALVYEFLPNGSLEDRLDCASSTPPLTWQVRTRIMAEICCALIFLHGSKPHPVVHGDLKPANILLDSNLVSKLSDFGICRLLSQSDSTSTICRRTQPKGTFAFLDPEFLTTGELTTKSDTYSFGIIILQLLTGKPAVGIARHVQEALDKGLLHSIMDPSAGDWPFVQAKQLAHLALRCCEMSRKNRPDLVEEVWRVVESVRKAASLSESSTSLGSFFSESNRIPSYFICPIFQLYWWSIFPNESSRSCSNNVIIMRDPHIAADGFSYEADAIKGWIDTGHDTSPMTNLKLLHCDVTPNRALRSAIQEWFQQQQPQLPA